MICPFHQVEVRIHGQRQFQIVTQELHYNMDKSQSKYKMAGILKENKIDCEDFPEGPLDFWEYY